jgi:hypothetical protein
MSSIESILHTISWKQRTVVFLFIYEGKEGLAVFFIYFYGDGLGNTLGLFLFVGSLVFENFSLHPYNYPSTPTNYLKYQL